LLLRLAMRCWDARQHLACMVKCRRGRHEVLREAIAVSLLVAHVLKALGAPHLIGGSLASAAHGAVRATMDAHLLDRALSEAGLEKG